jgi:hypothetical protein
MKTETRSAPKSVAYSVFQLYMLTNVFRAKQIHDTFILIHIFAGNHKAYLDLWNRILGMRQQIAYSQNATKPVQNTADDHKCALVCD